MKAGDINVNIRNVILVHGYFLEGNSWNKVIPLLSERSIDAIAVQISLSSLSDDVAIVHRAIEMQDGPVILVGQSYGGAVITEAGNHTRVAGLVYIAGAAPDSGQSVDDWWSGYATAAVVNELRPWGDAHVTLTRDGVRKYLGQDLPTAEADIVYATQGPLGTRSTLEKISKKRVAHQAFLVHGHNARPHGSARGTAGLRRTYGCRDHGCPGKPLAYAFTAESRCRVHRQRRRVF